jgi:hypothetical protein
VRSSAPITAFVCFGTAKTTKKQRLPVKPSAFLLVDAWNIQPYLVWLKEIPLPDRQTGASAMSLRLLPLILLFAWVPSPASSQERLKPLEFLIGAWESSAQVNGQDINFVAKWDWSLNKNFVASEMSIIADGTAVYKTTGMNAWDAKDQELLGWAFHSDGKYFRYKVMTKGKGVAWESTGSDAAGRRVAETVTIVPNDDGELEMVVSGRKQGDESMPDINLVWKRR